MSTLSKLLGKLSGPPKEGKTSNSKQDPPQPVTITTTQQVSLGSASPSTQRPRGSSTTAEIKAPSQPSSHTSDRADGPAVKHVDPQLLRAAQNTQIFHEVESDDDTNFYKAPPSADGSPLSNGRSTASAKGYHHLNNNSAVVTSFHYQPQKVTAPAGREPPRMESSSRNFSSPSSSPAPALGSPLGPQSGSYIAHHRSGSGLRPPTPPRVSVYHGNSNSNGNFSNRSRTGSGMEAPPSQNNNSANQNTNGSRSGSASPKPNMLSHTPPRRHSPTDPIPFGDGSSAFTLTNATHQMAPVNSGGGSTTDRNDTEIAELTAQQTQKSKSSTGFRHMRRPSSPCETSDHPVQDPMSSNNISNTTTGGSGTSGGFFSLTNGLRSSSAPTPADSELNIPSAPTPFSVAHPTPDPSCVSTATLVTYTEFCANIFANSAEDPNNSPRLPVVSKSTGTGPASFVDYTDSRELLGTTQPPKAAPAPPPAPPVNNNTVAVLYSASPFGEEDHLSTTAFAGTSTALLVAEHTIGAISDANSSTAEGPQHDAEMASTAFLRRPLAAFCRSGKDVDQEGHHTHKGGCSLPVGRTGSSTSTASGVCRTASGASSSVAIDSTTGATYYLHQHYCHKPIPAHTPQRTPRVGLLTPTDGPFADDRSPNEYRMVDGGDGEGPYEGIPEGLLATEGTALSASFSLAPTMVTTPDDPHCSNISVMNGGALSPSTTHPPEEPKPAIITTIDLVAYHGTIACVIGDVTGRVDLMEAKEPRTVLPSAASLFSRRHMLRGSMHFGKGANLSALLAKGGPLDGDVSDSASNATTPQAGHSPAQGFSPAAGEVSESTIVTPVVGTPTNNLGSLGLNAGYKTNPSQPPTVAHGRFDSFDDPSNNVSILVNGTATGHRSGLGRSLNGSTPPPRPSKFAKKCSHQAFVEEFDCRKSNTIDHQLRCVRFLPANRSPGVTSYLAANEKTIKLFRIRSEQFQHAHGSQHNQMIHLRRRSNNVGGVLSDRASINSLGSPDGGSDLGGMFANNGDYFPVTPRQRFHKRIVMPVKAFANVHQYNIQSLSLSADSETFLSLDDLQVFWWHLEAQDTTKATKLADLKPESGQPDILLTAAAFHPQHGSLFLVSNSNGVCEVGDLRDPPCRRKREYKISFQIKPDLHNSAVHSDHNDILSAISAASFMGKDFVVTRDYISLKMWDMRNPTHPVATCPVMDYLAPTLDFLYDKDYIFDRFPLAVDDQSLTVATGLYAGTVAVWRPGREPAGGSHPRGVRSGTYGTPSHPQQLLFDEVEFFCANEASKVPDEYGACNAVANGYTSLDDVVKRIVIDTASDDDEPATECSTSHEPLDGEYNTSDEPVYPRMRSQAHADRVTNVAISQGGDRVAFTTNDHLFSFARR